LVSLENVLIALRNLFQFSDRFVALGDLSFNSVALLNQFLAFGLKLLNSERSVPCLLGNYLSRAWAS